MRYAILALILLLPLSIAACGPQNGEPQPPPPSPKPPPEPEPEPEPVFFEIGFPSLEEGRFVIGALTDPEKIAQARKAIEDPETNPHSVMGILVKSPAPYNPPWSYHLDPATIELFDQAVEVCDASPQYVEEHLEEACGAFLPDCRWCPWSSKVLAEIADPAESESGSSGEEPASAVEEPGSGDGEA